MCREILLLYTARCLVLDNKHSVGPFTCESFVFHQLAILSPSQVGPTTQYQYRWGKRTIVRE